MGRRYACAVGAACLCAVSAAPASAAVLYGGSNPATAAAALVGPLPDRFDAIGFGPVCGDGVVDAPWEDCDDGNTLGGDGQTELPTGLAAALQGESDPRLQLLTSDGECFGLILQDVKQADSQVFKATGTLQPM